MSRDIRSYFSSGSNGKTGMNAPSSKPKRRRVISSDDDDVKLLSPVKRTKKTKKLNKNSISSDSDEEAEKLKNIVSPKEVFGKKPISRQDGQKVIKQLQKKEAHGHKDDNFEATLIQLDTSKDEEKYLTKSKSKESDKNEEKTHQEFVTDTLKEKRKQTPTKNKKENERSFREEKTPEKSSPENKSSKLESQNKKHLYSPKKEAQDHSNDKHGKQESKHKKKSIKTGSNISKLEVKVMPPKKKESPKKAVDVYEERAEKRKQGSALYQQYLQRGGARNPGSKEVPTGAPNCLAKLSFVVTGVLESLEREEAEDLIKQYGGRIMSQVSKNTDYLVVGDQSGPSKLAKAETFNIKKISEDELLEMIRTRSAGSAADIKQSKPKSKDRTKRKSVGSEEMPTPPSKKLRTDVKQEIKKPEEIKPKVGEEHNEEEKKSLQMPPKIAEQTIKVHSPVKKETIVNRGSILEDKTASNDTKDLKIKMDISHDVDANTLTEALVEKYRPKTMKQILGQQGDKSNAKKLHTWLMNWHKNQSGDHKHAKPSPWAKNDNGAFFKAALLSGPPGIGKTTTVQVVCNELGFDLVEFNASDTRSKKLLKEEVSELLSNTTLKDYFKDNTKKTSTKHVLLMDEVDGMAGNQDRGGLQELISLIKSSDIPIVCICNDRNNPKMRTLSNYTFDLRFQKPRLEQIRGAMKSICFKEKINISAEDLDRLIEATNQDIRQVINHLALFVGRSGSQEKSERKHVNKDLKLGPWDVVRKVFSADEHKHMSIHDKSDLFFHDYNIAALFVQENYLSVIPHAPKNELLERVAQSAESLALGDIVEKSIRSDGAWSLLPLQAYYSSVIPGTLMSGHIGAQINFPSWLGRNSRTNKFDRLTQEITVHARLATGASKEAITLDYIKHLRDNIVRPLAVDGVEGVDSAMDVMNHYHLLREDLDSMVEISLWPNDRDPMQVVESKVKAAFTRAYNKSSVAVPYTVTGTTSKKKAALSSQDEDIYGEEDDQANSDEDNDNVESDKMIKAKKPTTSKKTESKSKNADKAPKGGKGRGKAK